MKNLLPALLFSLIYFSNYSRITFQPGYFIDNKGERTNCLIKNTDWKNNPSSFTYKLTESSRSLKTSIEGVREFGIEGEAKYVRYTIPIDRSSDDLNALGNAKQPVFKTERLFLKSLIEGNAVLYYYEDNNLRRFFFTVDGSAVQQLVYKRYHKSPGIVGQNMRFRQQLWNHLKCTGITRSQTDRLAYKKEPLIRFFHTFNSCRNPSAAALKKNNEKLEFNLVLRPGLNLNSLLIENSSSVFRNTDFGQNPGIRIGGEFLALLPFNKNKWGLFFEPTFQSYSSSSETTPTGFSPTTMANVDYKSFELPMGLRHYMFLNKSSKLFLNAAFVFDKGLGSKINFDNGSELEIESLTNWALGAGYSYANKLTLEFRYNTNRELLRQ